MRIKAGCKNLTFIPSSSKMAAQSSSAVLEITHETPTSTQTHTFCRRTHTHIYNAMECSRLHPNHHYLKSNGLGLLVAMSASPLKTRHRINISLRCAIIPAGLLLNLSELVKCSEIYVFHVA